MRPCFTAVNLLCGWSAKIITIGRATPSFSVQDCWTICKSPSESPFLRTLKSPLLPYPHRGLKRSVTQLLIILFPNSLLLAKTLYCKKFQACLGIYCLVCMSKPFHWLNWKDNQYNWCGIGNLLGEDTIVWLVMWYAQNCRQNIWHHCNSLYLKSL